MSLEEIFKFWFADAVFEAEGFEGEEGSVSYVWHLAVVA